MMPKDVLQATLKTLAPARILVHLPGLEGSATEPEYHGWARVDDMTFASTGSGMFSGGSRASVRTGLVLRHRRGKDPRFEGYLFLVHGVGRELEELHVDVIPPKGHRSRDGIRYSFHRIHVFSIVQRGLDLETTLDFQYVRTSRITAGEALAASR
jgi:hypothetical protein